MTTLCQHTQPSQQILLIVTEKIFCLFGVKLENCLAGKWFPTSKALKTTTFCRVTIDLRLRSENDENQITYKLLPVRDLFPRELTVWIINQLLVSPTRRQTTEKTLYLSTINRYRSTHKTEAWFSWTRTPRVCLHSTGMVNGIFATQEDQKGYEGAWQMSLYVVEILRRFRKEYIFDRTERSTSNHGSLEFISWSPSSLFGNKARS